MYSKPQDVDLYVGIFLEGYDASNGETMGSTAICLNADQFLRLKKGDRFYYELRGQAGSFARNQLRSLRTVKLARLICDNSNLKSIQMNAFKMPRRKK